MYELVSELPAEEIRLLPVIPISEQAVHGIAGYGNFNRRTYDEERLLDTLYDEQPELYSAMEFLCAQWGLYEEEELYFNHGFALTYAAIANQARLINSPIERFTEVALNAVTGNIQSSDEDGLTYIRKALSALEAQCTSLTREWLDYLRLKDVTIAGPMGTAFILGGVLAHDLVRENLNHGELIHVYESRTN